MRRRIAYLFQGAALFDSLSVGENVAYGLREQFWNTMSEDEIAARVEQSLALVGLPGIEDDAAERSLGRHEEARRPRAHARAPARGDPLRRADDRPRSRSTRRASTTSSSGIQRALKLTSVVVTHDMGTAFSVSDRLAMIGRGRIVLVGTKDDFKHSTDPSVRDFIEGRAPETEDVAALLASS